MLTQVDPVNKSIRHGAKTTTRISSKPVLFAQYSCKEGSDFRIPVNTPIKKESNHYIYGDRVEKILNQVHEFYDKTQSREQASNFVQTPEKLVKTLYLPLGDEQIFGNNEILINEVFPKMSELKEAEKIKEKKYHSKIWLQVRWKNCLTVENVRTTYLNQYEPELLANYRHMREKFSAKWKSYVKSSHLKNHFKEKIVNQKALKVNPPSKSDKIQNRSFNHDKTAQIIQLTSSDSSDDQKEPIEQQVNQPIQEEKDNEKQPVPNEQKNQENQCDDMVENNFKRKSSYNMIGDSEQTQTKRKLLKVQQEHIEEAIRLFNEQFQAQKISSTQLSASFSQKLANEKAPKPQNNNVQHKRYSFLSKPSTINPILNRLKVDKPIYSRPSFFSKPNQIKHKQSTLLGSKGSPTVSVKSEQTVASSQKSETNKSKQELKETGLNKYSKSMKFMEGKMQEVIEIDDE